MTKEASHYQKIIVHVRTVSPAQQQHEISNNKDARHHIKAKIMLSKSVLRNSRLPSASNESDVCHPQRVEDDIVADTDAPQQHAIVDDRDTSITRISAFMFAGSVLHSTSYKDRRLV